MEDIQPTKLAAAPFNDLTGDIILRSNGADKVDFRTHKLFLIHASPVFEAMVSLPQGQTAATVGDVPVVNMHEDENELGSLLLFCHPGTVPQPPTSLLEVYTIYRIADKYMMDGLKGWLRKSISSFAEEVPVGVYMLARHFDWVEEASSAARKCLSHPLADLATYNDPVLRHLSANFLRDLLQYHQDCCDFLSNSMRPQHWIRSWVDAYDDTPFPPLQTASERCCSRLYSEEDGVYVNKWCELFLNDLGDALAIVPCFDKVPLTELYRKISKQTVGCPNCGPVALDGISSFLDGNMKRISGDVARAVPVPGVVNEL
ncbi:hypothetical protein QCA50_009077 [Cerrena zonata]|uniref:BTB domain-containing protein n=1 Tax=Cerrena zonata TaxID=2478898 RepID=A0AAW0GD26_9APHY